MVSNSGLSRRSFLALSAAAIAAPAAWPAARPVAAAAVAAVVAAAREPLKFWNMPWGQTTFNPLDEKITKAYKPAEGLPPVTYQVIQWANFTQTFASAVASQTNPAVSSGGGTQVFQFEDQGGLHYADDLYDHLEGERSLRRLPAGSDRHPEGGEGLRGDPLQPRHARHLDEQGPARRGGGRGAHGLAVLPGRRRSAEEEQHLRLRHRIRRRRLHRSARASSAG